MLVHKYMLWQKKKNQTKHTSDKMEGKLGQHQVLSSGNKPLSVSQEWEKMTYFKCELILSF